MLCILFLIHDELQILPKLDSAVLQNVSKWHSKYCNDPKFLDRQVLAKLADPDQTAPKGVAWSGATVSANSVDPG